MDYLKINKTFWNKWSREGGPWSQRCSNEKIQKARSGKVEIGVTTDKLVPESWFPKNWNGLDILGLASGGGQQIPILAATGANVTSFDFSEEQLNRDLEVCKEEGLEIKTQKGKMEDLGVFIDESFDFVINPVSTCFTSDVRKVWKEVYRVLRPSGIFISGFCNPISYALDRDSYEKKNEMKLIHRIPYSDTESLSEKEIKSTIKASDSLEFGHSFSDLIGGQTDLGFQIVGFYESYWGEQFPELIDSIMPSFIATRTIK